MATESSEAGALLLSFDAFGQEGQGHGVAQGYDRLGNRAAGGVNEHIPHKSAINFQLVEGQALEIGKGGIAGAEVVEGKFEAVGLELGHDGDGFFKIIEEHALGNFEFEAAGVGAGAVEDSEELVDKVGLTELAGADIDGDGERGGMQAGGPGGELGACGFERELAERNDEASLLGERDEFGRGQNAASGVVPAE